MAGGTWKWHFFMWSMMLIVDVKIATLFIADSEWEKIRTFWSRHKSLGIYNRAVTISGCSFLINFSKIIFRPKGLGIKIQVWKFIYVCGRTNNKAPHKVRRMRRFSDANCCLFNFLVYALYRAHIMTPKQKGNILF